MGGTTGKLTHIGLGKETIFGTAVGAAVYLPYISESLQLVIEPDIPANIYARRNENNNLEGLHTIAGDTVHEVHPAGIGYLLRSNLGSPISTDNTGSYTHVFNDLSARARSTGTATATTDGTKVVDTGQSWATDEHNGRWVHIKTGSGAGAYGIITDTAATQLTVATSPAAASTDTYEILDGPEHCCLPPYTIEAHRDLTGATPAFRYISSVVNTLAFNYSATDRILKTTASWLGKDEANIADTTPSLPTTDPFVWADTIFGVGLAQSGTASGGSSTTIIQTGAGWTTNAYQNMIVLTTGGTAPNQCRKITSNTTDTLTCSPAFAVAPASTTTFKIFNADNLNTDMSWSWAAGLIATPTSNNSRLIHKIESDANTTGTVSKTAIPEQITDFSTYYRGWATREWCIYIHGAQITGNHYYDMIFYFPRVLFMTYPINVGGPAPIRVASDIKIERDNTAGYAYRCIVNNNTSTYA